MWKFTKEKPLRVFTAFSGYDSQCIALRNIGVPYVLVGWSEIDKYAIQAHNAIFPEDREKNYGDISKIEWGGGPDFDLFTYSFPCTDISNAGQQQGLAEGSGTRSSLLWECRKAIVTKHPKYLLMENVKNLVSNKFLPYFKAWLDFLTHEGYVNYAQVLNAKDYGVPQNRERIFVVSILGNDWYNFPKPFPLEKRLIDILEPDVDEKYYISDEKVLEFLCQLPEKVREQYGIEIPEDVLEKYNKETPVDEIEAGADDDGEETIEDWMMAAGLYDED